jgi:tetratricopeptide (TPR) repeat protein
MINRRHYRTLLMLLFILPAALFFLCDGGCRSGGGASPGPFKTEPVKESGNDERERRIQSLENGTADITAELVNALSARKLSAEEGRLTRIVTSSKDNGASRIALGNVYLSQRRYQSAEREFRAAAGAPSGKARALCLLAMTAYIRGDWISGEKIFNEALARFPASPEPHVVRGDTWMYLWNLADAEKEYVKALSFSNRESYLMVAYGDLLCRNGRYDAAEKQYRDALARSPKEPIILEKLGNLAMLNRKGDEARKCYEESRALAPRDPLIAMKSILAADSDQALSQCGKAAAEGDSAYRDYFRVLLGQMLLIKERYGEASDVLKSPFRDQRLTRLSSFPLALALYRQKKEKEAYAILDGMISRSPFDSKALALRAWLDLRNDNLSGAIVDSAKSADIKPYTASQQMLQRHVLSHIEEIRPYDLVELIRDYEKKLADSDDREAIHYTLGVLLLKAGEYVESIKHFRMAAEGDDGFYMRKVASILSNGGNDREALAALRKAIDRNKSDFVTRREEGALYLRMNRRKEALELFSALSLKERDDAFILYFKALALRSMCRQKEAVSAFARACEMDSELPSIFFQMAESYEKLNDRKNALLLFRLYDRQERIKAVQDREKLAEARKRSERINKELDEQSGRGAGSSK